MVQYSPRIGNRVPCTPSWERMKHLYALGYEAAQMTEILQQEYGDIDVNPLSIEAIKQAIKANKEEFDEARANLGITCREAIVKSTEMHILRTMDMEGRIVNVYLKQLNGAVNQLTTLDIDEKDELGNYKNTSRIFVLIELIDKLHSKVAKVVGTDVMREVEAYRQKMEAKQKAEDGGLVPTYGKTIDMPTRFIS